MNHVAKALLDVLKVLPAAVAALPQVAELVQEVSFLGGARDQGELKQALAKAIADNKEGFEELDKKLGGDGTTG